jgi:hypothetical protein
MPTAFLIAHNTNDDRSETGSNVGSIRRHRVMGRLLSGDPRLAAAPSRQKALGRNAETFLAAASLGRPEGPVDRRMIAGSSESVAD